MAKKKEEPKFRNVALLPEDHDRLRELADADRDWETICMHPF